MLKPIDVGPDVKASQIGHVGGRHFAAPTAAAREGKVEQGAVAQARQGVVAGGRQRFQLSPGDGRLLSRALPAFMCCTTAFGQQLAHFRCFARSGAGQASFQTVAPAAGGSSIPAPGDDREASCTCLTEQGTKYDISQPECRTLARFVPVYNPYKAPKVEQYQQASVAGGSESTSVGGSQIPGTVVGYKSGQRADVFPTNPAKTIGGYTPPTTTL